MRFLLFCFEVATILAVTECAKILCVFHLPSYSHFQLGERLSTALASRGHKITVITPFAPEKKLQNTKHLVLHLAVENIDREFEINLFEIQDVNKLVELATIETVSLYLSESVLKHSSVRDLLSSNETFDAVIVEPINEALFGFCHHFGAHCILLNPTGSNRKTNDKMGNTGAPSYLTEVALGYTNMNFLQRSHNSFVYFVGNLIHHLYGVRQQNYLLQKYFPNAPHLTDLYYNASLMLLNSHSSINPGMPVVPNMIEIGGYHIKPPKTLTAELQNYMDGSKHGVVCFSLGSNLKSSKLPIEKREAILRVFGKLKYDVLWKWEDDNLPGKPANVKIVKWLPISDILAHPNMKVFITHGGLLSTIEAVYHGVPLVGIPIFGDQNMNFETVQAAGYGIKVEFKTLTERTLGEALNEVLNNPKYAEIARMKSKIMLDEPMKPLDKAIFWIEYVIRHNGASHLRTAALKLYWYQYLLLDVAVLVLLFVSVVLLVVYQIVLKILYYSKCYKNFRSIKKIN